MMMETTFCELRKKEVVNMVDGRRLGHIIDIVIDLKCGKVCGIIVPGRIGGFFSRCEDLYIEWCNICKIGDDVILVEIKGSSCPGHHHNKGHGKSNNYPVLYENEDNES